MEITSETLDKMWNIDGMTIKQIADYFNLTKGSVYWLIRKNKLKSNKRFILDKNTLNELYINQFKSCTEISKILSISVSKVLFYLKKFDLTIRKNGWFKKGKKPYNYNKKEVACEICGNKLIRKRSLINRSKRN